MEDENKKEKICIICKFNILADDDFINFRYFQKGKFHHEEDAHMKCWLEKTHPKRLAMEMASKANLLLNKMGGMIE